MRNLVDLLKIIKDSCKEIPKYISKRKETKKKKKIYKELADIAQKYRQLQVAGDAEVMGMLHEQHMRIYEQIVDIMQPNNYQYVSTMTFLKFNALRKGVIPHVYDIKKTVLQYEAINVSENDISSELDEIYEKCSYETGQLMDDFIFQIEYDFVEFENLF